MADGRASPWRSALVAFVAALLSVCASHSIAATTTYTSFWFGGTIAPSDTVVLNNGASVLGNVVANGTLQFNQSAPSVLTISRNISGTGALSLTNTGTLNLTGTSVSATVVNLNLTTNAAVGLLQIRSGTGNLTIGSSGTGTLNVTGGRVTNSSGYLGLGAGSVGTATVSSGTWDNSSDLSVGYSGTGTLNVTGGSVTNTSGYLGRSGGSVGTATVSSGTWASSELFVGAYGTGTLNVTGGSVTNSYGSVGWRSRGVGTVTVASGTWASSGDVCVGESGTGTLNVIGGSVTNTAGYLGYYAGSAGTVIVSSGTWANSGNLAVGVSGTGRLTISGGLVTVGGTLSRGANGAINVMPGGTIQIGVGGTTGVLLGGTGSLVNNGTLIFNRSDSATYSGNISGNGAILQQGGGTLRLAGSSTFTGPTTIQQGRIRLAHASALAASTISILTGGTLSLTPGLTTTVGGLKPGAGGVVDVGTGSITVLDGLSSFDLYASLSVGRGTGAWDGTRGIRSSAAAASGGARTVGWLDNGDGSVTFGYAASGDSNLDWTIDVLDVANFIGSGKFNSGLTATWAEGDFNYDGFTDILDVADFMSSGLFNAGPYNTPAGNIAAVPEPGMTGIVAAGIGLLGLEALRRKRAA